jgi:hypothetical protein
LMLNLIRKDLLMHKTGFPVYVSIIVGVMALQAWRDFSLSLYITLTCTYGTIFPAGLIAIEDRFRAGAFNCSLPVTRSQIVRAKYVISWAIAVIVALNGLALYSVIAAKSFWAIWTMSTVGQVLVTLALGLGMTLPVLLRFGWWGLIGGFIGMQVVGIITVLIVQALLPDLQLINSFIAISDFVANRRAQLGGPLFLTAIVVAGAVVNLVSCKIAVMLFERREF